MEDKQIIEGIREDRHTGFRVLIEQYQDMILNLAYSYLGNKEEAEDLTQDVFIKVYKKIHAFKGLSKLSTWMYRIAMNMCHDAARKKSKIILVPLEDNEHSINSTQNAADNCERKEIQRIIQEAIMQLPIKHRTIIILKGILKNYLFSIKIVVFQDICPKWGSTYKDSGSRSP